MPLFRDEPAVGGQLLRRDELFDLVDGDGCVDLAAHAGVLAAAVADASADGGQGVLNLDELQRLAVFSLRCELEIALHGDVRRAVGLAGRGAAVDHVLAVKAVLGVPFILGPVLVARGDDGCDVRNDGRLGAELLTQLQRVDGAVFHALTAGDALCGIDFGNVVTAHHIDVFKHRGGAEREAPASAAIADGVRFSATVGIRNLVHESVFFRALEDFIRFRARDLAATTRADIVFRSVAHLDAHVLFEMSAAFAHDLAVGAAAARRHGEDIVFLQIRGDFFVARLAAFAVDGALDRNHAHETHADGEGAGAHRPAYATICFHRVAHDGILLHHVEVVDDHLHGAGNPGLRPEHVHAVDVVDEASAVNCELHQLLMAPVLRFADDGGDIRRALFRIRTKRKADFAHVVGYARFEDDIFRVVPVIAALVARLEAGLFSADHVGKRHDVVAVLANVSLGEGHLGDAIHNKLSLLIYCVQRNGKNSVLLPGLDLRTEPVGPGLDALARAGADRQHRDVRVDLLRTLHHSAEIKVEIR